MTTRATSSHTKELPITSMLDHSESQRTLSHRIQQQQSNIYTEDNDKSARSLSFETPSKTTIKMSRKSSQSFSPVHSKPINTQQSNGSIQSRKVSSINDDVIENKNTSNIVRNDDKRSFKENINQNPSSYQIHVSNIL
jgi:hypothetical protein